jgi:hypothetical protein
MTFTLTSQIFIWIFVLIYLSFSNDWNILSGKTHIDPWFINSQLG